MRRARRARARPSLGAPVCGTIASSGPPTATHHLTNVVGMSDGGEAAPHPAIAWAEVTIDYVDTERAATFWSSLLGVPASTQRMEGWYQLAPMRGGPVINLQPVEEAKSGKARAHLDFWVDDLEASLAFVQQLGGTVLNQHNFEEWAIAVMEDPEGIEFCLVAKA